MLNEADTLAKLIDPAIHDTLLLKLLSSEMRVPDTEKFLEDVA
jgi:hypothetical protein